LVGKDGWEDVSYDMDTGLYEIGYPLCKRCLDARGPTVYDLEREIREIGTASSTAAKERVAELKTQVAKRMKRWRNE
jgi:hypothetical protein